jgi:diacylglycerol kinase (ATP)
MKNRPFRARLGFALAGLRIVWTRERSFRTQCGLALVAAAATAVLRPARSCSPASRLWWSAP